MKLSTFSVTSAVFMSVQLVLAGLVLTYIFKNPHPALTLLYLTAMIGFAIYRVLSKNKGINRRFQQVIGLSIALPGLFVAAFFIYIVVGETSFDPQYIIPIAGMAGASPMMSVVGPKSGV